MSTRYVGSGIRRLGDPRLLLGRGRYVADLDLPHLLHAAFVRTPYAHAEVRAVDLAAARALPGVAGAYAAADLGPAARPLPVMMAWPGFDPATQPALAAGRVRCQGEAVAVVVAADRYQAEDAAEAVQVDYAPLPAAVEPAAALAPDAACLHERAPGNRAVRIHQQVGDVAAALAAAPCRFHQHLSIRRGTAQPIECRGVAASWEPGTGQLTVWTSTQAAHVVRRGLAQQLGLAEADVRVVAPDVGGGFGTKTAFYPEEVVVAWLALRLGRAVSWIEDRREHLLCAYREGNQELDLTVGCTAEGEILALDVQGTADLGAYAPWGLVIPWNTTTHFSGCYRIPHLQFDLQCAYTNAVPVAAVRGAGRPQGVFIAERAADLVARELGLDPVAVRQRNLVPPAAMPYTVGLRGRGGEPVEYDSGDYPGALSLALAQVNYAGFRREQAALRARGRYQGIGVACYVEETAVGPYEGALARLDTSGRVVVMTGVGSQGQGHETALAQVAADEMGVIPDQVRVIQGDTGQFPAGFAAIASRTAVVTGNAVARAARGLREKVLAAAALMLEAAVDDLDLSGGRVRVKGTAAAVSLAELGRAAAAVLGPRLVRAGLGATLEHTDWFSPPRTTWGNGVQVIRVEVDPETGDVRILECAVVHDCGRVINPVLVDGQVHGGVVHGVGHALYEDLIYDPAGQLMSGSLMDYLLPTAAEAPPIRVQHMESPSPHNPLGLKGAGEGGAIPAAAAVAQAIEDALRPFGAVVAEMPLSPPRVRELITSRQVTR